MDGAAGAIATLKRVPADAGLPAEVLAWVERAAGCAVADVTAVGGGITHTKWRLRLGDRDLVLRWADPQRWGRTGREHVRREVLGLQLLAGSGLPVPHLVAAELNGAGGAAALMTWCPGRVRLDPLGDDAMGALAQLTVAVHNRFVAAARRPPTFAHRGSDRPAVPGWSRRPDLWRRALELRAAGRPATSYALVHRDLHLGNVLWVDDTVTGLIDWAETSWGPPDIDVAHLCSDFAMLDSLEAATAFRTAYLDRGGRLDPDPVAARYWVVSDVVGFLPDPAHVLPAFAADRPDLTADQVRDRLEDLLASTLDG